jgi:integrase
MNLFVDEMSGRGLAVVTLNERLAKVKSVYKILKAKDKISANPAAETIGKKQNSFAKREKRRLPFDQADLRNIFSSPIFNDQQLRSQGQAGEGSYWIPLMMYYSGARTEEIAGLALADMVYDPLYGWYFNIIDRPSQDDDLFDDEPTDQNDAEQREQWRTLKNEKSIRKVPVAPQLIELGLLHYVDWVKSQGGVSFFPSLSHDWHDKLSGAFSKFFGRYKKQILRIDNPKKVLYSFRHTMKDAMTRARVDSKYLKRILGHASGEGSITDGYGCEDVPLGEVMAEFFKVKFFPIGAKPWQPGKGYVKYPKP